MPALKLILWKIINIVATRCRILKVKCTKIDFGSLQRSPRLLAGFKGDYFEGKEGEEGREGRAREEGWKG